MMQKKSVCHEKENTTHYIGVFFPVQTSFFSIIYPQTFSSQTSDGRKLRESEVQDDLAIKTT